MAQQPKQVQLSPWYILVVGYATVDDGFLVGVDDDEWQLYGGVRLRHALLGLHLTITLNQVLEGNLLQSQADILCAQSCWRNNMHLKWNRFFLIFYNFWTLKCHWKSKVFLTADNDSLAHIISNGCRWPGYTWSQGIINHSTDLVLLEYSGLSARGVKTDMLYCYSAPDTYFSTLTHWPLRNLNEILGT